MQDEEALEILRVLLANGCTADSEIAIETMLGWVGNGAALARFGL